MTFVRENLRIGVAFSSAASGGLATPPSSSYAFPSAVFRSVPVLGLGNGRIDVHLP